MAEENPFARLFKRPLTQTASLAVLQPGTKDAQISITVTDVVLSDTKYDCISYDRSREWPTRDILVNGSPSQIPETLEHALRALRREATPRMLWADLLVGSSAEERSQQAALMKNVIENAQVMHCFVHLDTQAHVAAFDVLQTLANWFHQAALSVNIPANVARATMIQMEGLRASLQGRDLSDIQPRNTTLWQSIQGIVSSTYTKTVQSIPEVLLAKKVIFTRGTGSMSWEDYAAASKALPFYMQELALPLTDAMRAGCERIGSLEINAIRKRQGESLELSFP